MSAFAQALSEPGESIRRFMQTAHDAVIALHGVRAIGAPTALQMPDSLRPFPVIDDVVADFVAHLRQIMRQAARGREFFAVLLLLSPATNRDHVAVVVRWLVDHTPWKLWSDDSRIAQHERAADAQISVWEVRQQELTAGVYLALGSRDRLQRHRFGRKWLVGEDGRTIAVAPTDLAWDQFLVWLRNAARQAANASLLDRPFPALPAEVMDRRSADNKPLHVPLPDDYLLAIAEPDPLALLIDSDAADDDARRLHATLEVATPRERDLLALMFEGLSVPDAARLLGIAPSTARQHLFRLRKRVV